MSAICDSCGFLGCDGACPEGYLYIIERKDDEIERLKALLKDAALYLDMGDHGYPKSINPDGVFHHKFKHYSKVEL